MAFTYALSVLVCVCSTPLLVDAFSGGAPPTVCITMTPNHDGSVAQTDTPPFALNTNGVTEYQPGTPISVTITGGTFKGFMIQVRKPGGGGPVTIVGDFNGSPAGQLLECSGVAGNTLTHTNSDDKQNLVITWNPPQCDEGPLEFIATVVKEKLIWYIDIKSAPLTFQTAQIIRPVDADPCDIQDVTLREQCHDTDCKDCCQQKDCCYEESDGTCYNKIDLCDFRSVSIKNTCPGPSTILITTCACSVTCGVGTLYETWLCDKNDGNPTNLAVARYCCDMPCPGRPGLRPPPPITCAMVLPRCK